jgi:putative DNA primase/helicase
VYSDWRKETLEEATARFAGLQATQPGALMSSHQPGRNNGTAPVLESCEVSLIRGDSITPEPIRWVWEGWLAAGKFHVLAGQPGTGKTTIALACAATITSAGRWPDRSTAIQANVLIWSGEDDPKDTLVPRLRAMGADMTRVYFVGDVREGGDKRSFDPARDIRALVDRASAIGKVGLLIVDPIVSAVSGDSHKNAETRRSLQPLVELALRLDCVVLGISHFTKGSSGKEPIERVTGSLAFGALARVVLVAAKLKAEPGQLVAKRILARAKSNIGPDSGGFEYKLDYQDLDGFAGIAASQVLWGKALDGTARELLAEAEASEDGSQMKSPRDFLRDCLANGPRLAKDVFDEADAHGYTRRQMQNASNSLKVKKSKLGMDRGWEWNLTAKVPSASEDTKDTEQICVAPSVSSGVSSDPSARVEEF